MSKINKLRPPLVDEIKYGMDTAGNFKLFGYATGNYEGICVNCEETFFGDKRAVQCLKCAIKIAHKRQREPTDLQANFNIHPPTWLSHLILGSESAKKNNAIEKLTEDETYRLNNCDLLITINGIEFRAEKFELFLKYTLDRYTKEVAEREEKLDELVLSKAKEMLSDKHAYIFDKYCEIEELIDELTNSLENKLR